MDADKDGFVTFHDFCHFLVVPSDACSQAVFSALTETVRIRARGSLVVFSLSAGFCNKQAELQAVFTWSGQECSAICY